MNTIASPGKTCRIARFGFFIASLLICMQVSAQNGEELFKKNCGACHSVGMGRLVGPDLKGVTDKRSEEWLLKFIPSSQTFIQSGDPDAKAIYDEFGQMMMPDQNLSEVEIKAVLSYIASKGPAEGAGDGGGEAEATAPEPAGKSIEEATEEDVVHGRMLFTGEQGMANGGPSCMSCHNVTHDDVIGGGLLAKDLTQVYGRMGEAGIKGILNAPPFPAMTEAYGERTLTEDEIFQLTAFLGRMDKESYYQHRRDYGQLMLWGGGCGAFTLFGLISVMWFRRKKASVKKGIFDRQLKSK